MRSNGSRVVEVPELLSSVALQLGNWNCLRLMLVSKYCFRSVAPIVWRTVPRLDFLLRLIKDTTVEYHRPTDSDPGVHSQHKDIIITLPPELDLTRFDIYAPWIHNLELFDETHVHLLNIEPLLQLVTEQQLFPNLRHLTAYTGAPIPSDEALQCINLFLSPALTEIRTIFHSKGFPPHIQPASVPELLQKVLVTCPQIRALEFYPQSLELQSIGNGLARYYSPNHEYHTTLASLANLRSLASTLCILQPENFSALGNLPHLESLSIRGYLGDQPVLRRSLSVPDTWFPSLKELHLHEVHPADITTIWSQHQIVRKLTSASIHCDPSAPANFNGWPENGNEWIGQFILKLPRLSPHLKEFRLKAQDEDGTVFVLSPAARAAIRELGIRNFELEAASDVDDDYVDDEDDEDWVL